MNDQALTAERILDTAEEVLRRYGPAKATVIDVARRRRGRRRRGCAAGSTR